VNRILKILFSLVVALFFAGCDDSSSPSNDEEQVLISSTVKKDGDDMLKFGHLNLDVPADSFLALFELGDVVTVMIDGFDTLDAPVVSDYDDVAPGEFLLRVKAGKPHLTFAINFGQVAVYLSLPASFTTKLFKDGLVKGLRFMLENDAPYLVHCQMGKDRLK